MVRKLPKYRHIETGKIYYMDSRLGEFRAIDNPHDTVPITDGFERACLRPNFDNGTSFVGEISLRS